MEKNSTNLDKPKTQEFLGLSNRNNLKIEGIIEINSSSETLISIKLQNTDLVINGQNMHIVKLDISSGILEVSGEICCIKYGKSGNIFKRIFK